jgi:hypothetical protein
MAFPKKFKTPLQAIRAKCLDCSGGDAAEVAECAVLNCPLYAFRTGLELRCDAAPASEKMGMSVPEAGGPGPKVSEASRVTKLKQAKESIFPGLQSLL